MATTSIDASVLAGSRFQERAVLGQLDVND